MYYLELDVLEYQIMAEACITFVSLNTLHLREALHL